MTVAAPAKLNRTEAAAYLGVSAPTLASWATLGKGLKFYKAGHRVYYMIAELDRWIESRTTNCSSGLGTGN